MIPLVWNEGDNNLSGQTNKEDPAGGGVGEGRARAKKTRKKNSFCLFEVRKEVNNCVSLSCCSWFSSLHIKKVNEWIKKGESGWVAADPKQWVSKSVLIARVCRCKSADCCVMEKHKSGSFDTMRARGLASREGPSRRGNKRFAC